MPLNRRRCAIAAIWLVLSAEAFARAAAEPAAKPVFRARAYSVDIIPTRFPVIVNGMFEERSADRAFGKLHARAIVLDDGTTRVAIWKPCARAASR